MIAVSAWDKKIYDGKQMCPCGQVETRDLARGFAGALFVSLPLLFTMEMWQIARTIPDWVLLCFLALTLVINKLYLEFAGFRKKDWQQANWWDALVTMGIGIVASAITLYVTGTLQLDLHNYLIAKLIALETIPMSLGAAVAINQLGSGDKGGKNASGLKLDVRVLIGTVLGGYLFAFNIAPTVETKYIVMRQSWELMGATMALSIFVSYLTVAIANFETRDLSNRKIITSDWLEAMISYIVAFLVSLLLLWVFGYGTPLDPMEVWLPMAIALSYVTTLGGAAGRLIL